MSKTDIDMAGVASVDLESALIRPALAAPPPVCMSVFRPEGQADPGARLYGHGEWQPVFARLLADERISVVGHNFAYDAGLVLQWAPELRVALFAAYDQGRILDTGLAQRLVEIETGDKRGKLSLDQLGARYGLHVDKGAKGEDGENVRLGFGKFLGLPAAALPPAYRDYALGDADATHRLLGRILQRGLVSRRALAKMARSDLALKLVSAYGLVVDPDRVAALEDAARETLTELQGAMIAEGFMRWERGKPQPVRTMAAIRRAVAAAYGIPVDDKGCPTAAAKEDERAWRELVAQGVITDKGNVSTSKLVLEESGEPLLEHLGEYGEWAAVWNKDLKVFRWCAEHGLPIHSKFGFAGTLRSTCSGGGNQKNAVVAVPGMNQQNLRKKEGIRECIRSRLGGLVATDYTGLENGTLAQTIVWALGRRGMADKINAGHNFHAEVGCHILGREPTPENMRALLAAKEAGNKDAKAAYNAAKPLNFGLPGFMQKPETVQSYARIGYKVDRPVDFWRGMIDLWYRTQHDQVAYLKEYVESCAVSPGRPGSLYNVSIPGTDIVRRGATRTAAANTGFQGLGAVVATEGLYLVVRAQMLGKMPGKACAFVHDEVISDCARDDVEQTRYWQEKLMLAAASALMPDLKMKVASVAMTNWSKEATATYDERGRLTVTAA